MLIAGMAVAGLWLAPGASAKTFTVTSTGDPVPNSCGQGACTLREAIIAANNRSGADEVSLKARKTYELTQAGVDEDAGLTGDLDSTGRLAMTVRGKGGRPKIDGADLDRILHVFAPTRIAGIVFRNGNMSGASETGDGGGIFANGDLVLVRSVVKGNAASDNGEGVSADNGASITLIRSAVVKNLGQGVREEGNGSVVLRRSRVSGNDEVAVQEVDAGSIVAQRSTVSGNGGSGIREFDDGGVRVVRSKVLGNEGDGVDGSGPGALSLNRTVASGNDGFGVVNSQPTSRITRSVVARNDSGVFQYSGALRIARTQVLANESTQDGGGITALSTALLRVARTTVAGNRSTGRGGGIFLSGFPTTSPALITRSTISGNSADDDGGGIYADSRLAVTNSTIASNRGAGGGGIWLGGGTGSELNAVSVVRNVAYDDYGGGLYLANDAPLRVDNSLIGLNRATCLGCGSPDCINEQDPFTSGGNNLLSTKENCTGFDAPSDLERANPKIGKLRKNGGPTKTVALKKGSPAIGKAGNDTPNRDQRGVKRDNQPDIGAFER
jgi:CSLREA domain-containing protein